MNSPASLARFVAITLSCIALVGCSKKSKPEPAAKADAHAHHDAAKGLAISKISPDARVFFENLKEGQKVEGALQDGKVEVELHFGASGVKIQPAGKQEDFTGHHHLVINGAAIPVGTAVPADDTHIHYGKGQTKTSVALAPGKYKLTMQLADGAHLSYGPKQSATIIIEVVASST